MSFEVKDSGERKQFASGMVRDVTDGKINWSLVADGPMLRRYAIHLTKGAEKYAVRNWMQAAGVEEYERFRESAYRHFMDWYYGKTDEDHAAATWFNQNGAEYVKAKLDAPMTFEDAVQAAMVERGQLVEDDYDCPDTCPCNGGEAEEPLDVEEDNDEEYGCKACLNMLANGESLAFVAEKHTLWLKSKVAQA